MSLWLSVIGVAIVIAAAGAWMVRSANLDRATSAELDRSSLPEDQLGL